MTRKEIASMTFAEKAAWYAKWESNLPKAIEHLADELNWPKATVEETFGEVWESFLDQVVWCYFYMENELPDTPINTVHNYYKDHQQNTKLLRLRKENDEKDN